MREDEEKKVQELHEGKNEISIVGESEEEERESEDSCHGECQVSI